MAKKNTPKKILAGAMALMSVAAYVPADGISSLVNNYSIVASAEAAQLATITGATAVSARDVTTVTDEANGVIKDKLSGEVEPTKTKSDSKLGDSSSVKIFDGTVDGSVAVDITSGSSQGIGDESCTTIVQNATINVSDNVTVSGNVIMNNCTIKVTDGKTITVSGKLWLNGCTVTRTGENAVDGILKAQGSAKEAEGAYNSGTKPSDQGVSGIIYVNGSTITDEAAYKATDACAIRNSKGIVVIGGSDVQTITGVNKKDGQDSKYEWTKDSFTGNTKITSKGAAIQSGAGSYLCILDGEISGVSNETSTGSSGVVSGVVEIAGNADLVGGSVKDSEGKHAVTVIRKNGSSWYKNEQTDGSKAQKVNIGGYTDKSFTINGGLDVAQQPVGANDKVDDTQVSIADGAAVDNVTMGLPGVSSGNNNVKSEQAKTEHYNGGVLNVTGGEITGSVKMDDRYTDAHGTVTKYTTELLNGENAMADAGSVNITGGTVGSVEIPVTDDTRDSVTISGGTVTNTANAAFYQHNYSLSIDKTSDPDNTIVTLSCSDDETCGLKPVVLTFKNKEVFAKGKSGEYAVPTIKISGGTVDKEETIAIGDESEAVGGEDIAGAIKKAIAARGLRAKDEGGKLKYFFEVEAVGVNKLNDGVELDEETLEGQEETLSLKFTVDNNSQSTTNTVDMKLAVVAPELKAFTVTDPSEFYKNEPSGITLAKDETGKNYTMTYDSTKELKKSVTASTENSAPTGIVFYKAADTDVATNKFGDSEWTDTVKGKIDSIKIQFKKDGGEWADTAKDVGTYSVRYVLTLKKEDNKPAPDPAELYYYADYTIEIKKIQYNAGVYVDESKQFNNPKATGAANDYKVTSENGTVKPELYNALNGKVDLSKGVYATKGAVGDSLDDLFGSVYVYSGTTANLFNSTYFIAGAQAELYAVDVTTKQEYAATDALGKGVFAVRAKLTKTNANYELADEIIGYVVVSGISIADATVTLDQYTFIYDGSTKKPDIDGMKVEVKDGNTKKQLTIDKDFSVSGSYRAIKPGDYVFTITGEGDYDGHKEVVWHVTDVAGVAASKGVKTTIDFENNPTSTTKKLAAVAVRNVPKGYTVKEFGVLAANDANAADEKYLNLEVAKAQGKNEIKLDGGAAVTIVRGSTTKSTSVISSYSAGLSDDAPKGYAVRSYIKIEDAEGNEAVIYSDIKRLDKTEVKGVVASDKALAPKLQYEFIDGNVNRLKFTAIRKLPEDGGYTVEAMGILADSSSMSAEVKDGKSEFNAKALLIAPDDSNTYKGITTQKATVIGSAKSLTGLSASYSKSASFNDPDVEVTVRPYMVISKGGQKYYLYGEQIFIGKYGYNYDDPENGTLDAGEANRGDSNANKTLSERQILSDGDVEVPTIKK